MNTKRMFVTLLMAVVMASQITVVGAQSRSGFGLQANRLEGSWDVTLTFSDGSTVKSILTVMAGGRSDNEGSVIHSAELSFTPPNPTLPEQGSWRRTGPREFVASYRGFSYTEELQPFGKIGFRHAITLSEDGEEFTGQATFEVINADGEVEFSDQVQTHGVRQQAQGPDMP